MKFVHKSPKKIYYQYNTELSILFINSDLDLFSVPLFEKELGNIIDLINKSNNKKVAINLEMVQNFDTSGFAFIIDLVDRLSQYQINVKLVHNYYLKSLAQLYGLEDFINKHH